MFCRLVVCRTPLLRHAAHQYETCFDYAENEASLRLLPGRFAFLDLSPLLVVLRVLREGLVNNRQEDVHQDEIKGNHEGEEECPRHPIVNGVELFKVEIPDHHDEA